MYLVAPIFIERPAQRLSFADFRNRLQGTAQAIQARAKAAKNWDQADPVLRHIIGIERWGQGRLEVALGKPFLMDRYQDHYPHQTLSPEGLRQLFIETRKQTLNLLDELEKTPHSEKILHNGMGPLSVKGWLQYLVTHADLESRRIR